VLKTKQKCFYQQLNQGVVNGNLWQWIDARLKFDLPWEERDDGFLAMFEEMEDACEDLI
jgi:hypothetical protein